MEVPVASAYRAFGAAAAGGVGEGSVVLESVTRPAPAEVRLITVSVAVLLGMGAAIAVVPVLAPAQQAGMHAPHVPRAHPR
jgi:hypothetical protein